MSSLPCRVMSATFKDMQNHTLGQLIAQRRKERGWTHEVLASIMDVGVRQISRWENDQSNIPIGKQIKLIRLGLMDLEGSDVDIPDDIGVELTGSADRKLDAIINYLLDGDKSHLEKVKRG